MVDQGEYLLNLKDTNQFTPEDIKYNTLWSDAIVIVYSDSDITSLRYLQIYYINKLILILNNIYI